MRDFQRPAPCPDCASRNVAVLHATPTSLYLECRACDHAWYAGLGAVDPLRRRTSAAFRMTTRIMSTVRALADVA